MYTNVGEQLVIKRINKRLVDIYKIYKIPENEMIKGVKLIMKSTYFSFKGKLYLQIYSSPMGGPCSAFFANSAVDDSETECSSKLDFTPTAYYRYIDDIFAIIPKDKIEHISI